MNYTPEQARELVAKALESGDYIQGFGFLETQDVEETEESEEYVFLSNQNSDEPDEPEEPKEPVNRKNCCLGVACREFMKHEASPIEITADKGRTLFDGNHLGLPGEVQGWLGFDKCTGEYDDGCLTTDNDGEPLDNTTYPNAKYGGNKTFAEIAEIFRNPPEGMLV